MRPGVTAAVYGHCFFQCVYLVAQSRPCVPMYCSHITYGHCLFIMYLSCCAVTAMRPDVTAAVYYMDIDFSNVFNLLRSHGHASGCYCSRITWTLIVYNVFILLRSHGHASRCYCSRIWTLIFPMCLSCCAVTAMRPDVLQPYNIWTLIVYNVFILLRSHSHASRCYCSHLIYGH